MPVDVVVVGAGVAGLSAAWRAAIRGLTVEVLERDVPGSAAGSSHGATRIFRLAYESAAYVDLARRSLPLWRELERGDELVRITGGLDIGPRTALEACAEALRTADASFRLLEPDERARAFPWLHAHDAWGLSSPDGGVIAAARTIDTLLAHVRAAGGAIRTHTTVHAIEPGDGAVSVRLDGEVVRARRCIVAAGAWTAPLLAPLGIAIPLRITREQVVYFGGESPPIPVIERGAALRYLVPAMHGAAGAKAGEHAAGLETTPDARTFDEDGAATARVRAWIMDAVPRLEPEPVGYETCLYSTTPDEDFVLDAVGPLVVVSPCSGHGFKFAPMIGEIAACIAAEETPPVPLDRFRLARFAAAG